MGILINILWGHLIIATIGFCIAFTVALDPSTGSLKSFRAYASYLSFMGIVTFGWPLLIIWFGFVRPKLFPKYMTFDQFMSWYQEKTMGD